MRKIIYQRDDGVSIVTPVRNTMPAVEDLTDEEIEQRAWDALPADAIEPRFIEESELPATRVFRDAWTSDLKVDFAKAKEIAKLSLAQEVVDAAVTVEDLIKHGSNSKR